MQIELQDTVTAAPVALRTCPGCGEQFAPGGRGLGKTFHADECRVSFHKSMKGLGGPLAPMVLAWTATRHAKPGTREAEICTFARGQITQMAREMIETNDFDAVAYVGTLMDSGTLWCDRTRK